MEARSTLQTSGGLAQAPARLLLADGDSARAASLSPAAAASPSPQVLPSLPAAILPSSAS